MTKYPYSQQIHDKILNDWKNIPFDEWKVESYEISHPSVDYSLGWMLNRIRPYDSDLARALSSDHSVNLHNELMNKAKKVSESEKTEQAAKQFLGL